MSARPVHEAAANASILTARSMLRLNPESPWVPTIFFYVGVQIVEAALTDSNECGQDHDGRMMAIGARWPAGSGTYRKLKQLSEAWRYRGTPPGRRDVESAERWARDLAAAVGERWPEP